MPRRIELSPAVSLTEHFVELSLRIPESAVDSLVQILSHLGFGVEAAVNAHQPRANAASDDLADLSCHRNTSASAERNKWHNLS
jgi:hypothetical protein